MSAKAKKKLSAESSNQGGDLCPTFMRKAYMTILQLDPSIPLNTPKGPALAWLLIDPGEEHHLLWICAIDETGEIWTFANPEVRAQKNITMQRTLNKSSKMTLQEVNL